MRAINGGADRTVEATVNVGESGDKAVSATTSKASESAACVSKNGARTAGKRRGTWKRSP